MRVRVRMRGRGERGWQGGGGMEWWGGGGEGVCKGKRGYKGGEGVGSTHDSWLAAHGSARHLLW